MIDKETILKDVGATVRRFDPKADIILFGSQVRGDIHAESDWDFLVLTQEEAELPALKKAIRRALYFLELEYSIVISALVKHKNWISEMAETPFCKSVKREGVEVI